MSFKCNEDCELFKGNCGHHFKDWNGHIIWDCPCESAYDGVWGDVPSCFKPSEQYKKKQRAKEKIIVVRCMDCKHYCNGKCEWHNGFAPPLDWYCADGERW